MLGGAGGLQQDAALGLAVGIADVDLEQEAVELGFGQRIGAFLLDRVLGREHMEGGGQVVALAGDGDMVLLHRLQQRRLGARAGAVDLVRHQQLREDRALDEAEMALAVGALVENLGAEDVGRHQVRRELDAPRAEAEHRAHGLDQLGLGEAGHADEQAVAAGEQGDQREVDDLLLAEDDLADLGARRADGAERGLGRLDDAGIEIDRRVGRLRLTDLRHHVDLLHPRPRILPAICRAILSLAARELGR